MTKLRDALVQQLMDAEMALRLYDLAVALGGHDPGCECPRAKCTLARLTPIDGFEMDDPLKDGGL